MGKSYLTHKPVARDKVLRSHTISENDWREKYVVQAKYDGVSVIVRVNGLSPDAVEVFTRTGEPIYSLDHVCEALVAFPGILPGVYFGEGWIPDTKQPTINGQVMRKCASPAVKLVVYDFLTLEEYDAGVSEIGYAKRVSRLPEPFFRIDPDKAPLFPAVCEGTLDELGMTAQEAANQYVSFGGYDGVILRDPYGRWEQGDGRKGEIIKVKPGHELTLRVIGYEEGKGKHAGRIGTLIVSLNGKPQGAGTGLKDSQRDIARFDADWKDKLVEIAFLGYTEDGQLREPVLKGLRTDVLEPDA